MNFIKKILIWWQNYSPLEYDVLFKVFLRKCEGEDHNFPVYITYNSSRGANPTDKCHCGKFYFKEYCQVQLDEMKKDMKHWK